MATPEDRVKAIAAICYRISDEAIGIMEFLKTGNTREAAEALDGNAAQIANVIGKSMKARLVMAIMRMHDKPTRNRESLHTAFNLLRDRVVFNNLAAFGDSSRLKSATSDWNQVAADSRLGDIRRTRNAVIAHNISTLAYGPPIIIDLLDISNRTIKVAYDLAAGVGINTVTVDNTSLVWESRAKAYWSRLF